MTYCSRCAAALPGPPPVACTGCGFQIYVNARPTGSAIVLDGDRFLALRRAREPQAGLWEIPGGFCDGWEHPADAAVREVREECGVDVRLGAFVGMYVGSYRFQDEDLPVLDCFWLAEISGGSVSIDLHESSEFTWFPLAAPPPLAFRTMDAALGDIKNLRHP